MSSEADIESFVGILHLITISLDNVPVKYSSWSGHIPQLLAHELFAEQVLRWTGKECDRTCRHD